MTDKRKSAPTDTPHRRLPAVHALLDQCPELSARWGRERFTTALRRELADRRRLIDRGGEVDTDSASITAAAGAALEADERSRLRPVLNLTGTVLHTNLGRACLPAEAVAAVVQAAREPCNLEYDLDTGRRGDRESAVEALVCELTGSEAATVVNNNAAAVLLTLNTLALGRQVPVSRGELVEIGGSFRIPEVMQRAGCSLVEVGATNRTHLRDFDNAIGEHTALLMKVHTSNYRVEGFTGEVAAAELAALARQHGLPCVLDLGSGCLADFAALGLPPEPTAAQALDSGADLITFSGDKLLGGPQAGIVAGRGDLIARLKSNPLKRALRPDKMTLAALDAVLRLYRNPQALRESLPTLRQLTRPEEDIREQALRLRPGLAAALGSRYRVDVASAASQVGSGALPVETIPSACLRAEPADGDDGALRDLAAALRALPLPVIGRLHKGALWLDLRCLENEAGFSEQLERLPALLP